MSLVFLTGGVRSGKSSAAVHLAEATGENVAFVATATALDDEMRERIARHRSDRPPSWSTVEEPLDLKKVLSEFPRAQTVLIDCLTLWVTNLMLDGASDEDIVANAVEVATTAARRNGTTIVVTNEVGGGVHPETALGRRFTEVLGRVNQEWARLADEAFLVVAGRLLELGPARG